MKAWKALIIAGIVAGGARISRAGELQPVTLAAWSAYLKTADLHAQQRISGKQPFLWMDEVADRANRVRRGEVVIAPAVGHGEEDVPNGLVHHWVGAIFIPGAKIDRLLAVLHDYDNYEHVYRPVVGSCRTLRSNDTNQEFQMVWQRNVLFVNAAMQGRYAAHDVLQDARRGYRVAETVEVRQIEGYGHPGERLLPPDTGNGFLWRVRSIARFEERDGGLYLELEVIALTRDIPQSVAWMVKPLVNRLSVSSLTTTLRQTRDAVIDRPLRQTPSMVRCRSVAETATDQTSFGCVSAGGLFLCCLICQLSAEMPPRPAPTQAFQNGCN